MPALVEKLEEGRRFRPSITATLFTTCSPVAIPMVGLGTWQVERLAWKNALIKPVDSLMRAAPAPPFVIGWKAPPNGDFRRVSVTGQFLHDYELHLAPRGINGRVGYQIVTPLKRGRRYAGAGQPRLGAAGEAR